VQATEAAGDREHAAGGRTPVEVMATDAPGRRPSPGKLQHPVQLCQPDPGGAKLRTLSGSSYGQDSLLIH